MCAHGFPSLSPDYYVRDKPENVSIYASVCIYVIFGKEKTKKIIGSSGEDAHPYRRRWHCRLVRYI